MGLKPIRNAQFGRSGEYTGRYSIVETSREDPVTIMGELHSLKRFNLPGVIGSKKRTWILEELRSQYVLPDQKPKDFLNLLMVPGTGPKTIRALSMLAVIV